MAKSVKINGKEIACDDVLQIQMVCVSDELMYEVKYRVAEPTYHELRVLMDKDKGYALEKKVRKACLRK
jgi:hypothetical protein